MALRSLALRPRADAVCFNDTIVGIPATYFGLLTIFLTVKAMLTIGYLHDQVFSLWTEWRSVDMERIPMSPTPDAQLDDDHRFVSNSFVVNPRAMKPCRRRRTGSSTGARYADGEMFARAVQQWDKDMGPTPTFWFTDDAAMQRARDLKFEDEV